MMAKLGLFDRFAVFIEQRFPNGINVEVATQDAFGIVTEDHAAIDGDAAGIVLESFGQVLGQVIAGDEGSGFIRADVGAIGAVGMQLWK